MQLLSHSLGAGSSPERLPQQLWHFWIRFCTPSCLRRPDNPLCISSRDLAASPEVAFVLNLSPQDSSAGVLKYLCCGTHPRSIGCPWAPLMPEESRIFKNKWKKKKNKVKYSTFNTMILKLPCAFHALEGLIKNACGLFSTWRIRFRDSKANSENLL